MKRKHMLLTLLASTAVFAGAAQAAPVNISTLPGVTDDSGVGTGPFRVTGNVTLSSGTDYLLDKEIYVDGGTLTIQPGVMIPADADGSLIVTRGSQIFAEGTAEQPIIFTSLAEYNHITDPVNFPNAPEIGDNGEWGGVLILGKAPINFYVAGNPFTGDLGGNTNTGENQIEGVSAGPDNDGDGHGDLLEYGQDNALVGGLLEVVTPADPEDNSGVFKYVSIRFGGKVLGLDDEINGLTMGGVGSGTTIEYVEVINNSDDGFEWFGGTVNCNNLVSFANEDEDFDMDEGYSGKLQFLFALRNDDVDGKGNVENGSELDGGNGSILNGTPFTTAQIWNATYLGAGRVGSVATKGNVFRMKDNFNGQFHNCVFDDFGKNLVRIDDADTAANVTNGTLKIENSHWGRYNGLVAEGQTAAADALANGTGNTDPDLKIDPKMRGISRANNGQLDPRPAADSPLFNATLSTPPVGLETVSYRGAFGATNWAAGWTYLDSAGYFGDLAAGTEPVGISTLPGVTDDSGVGTGPFRITSDVTLISGVDYLLDKEIYVDGGTLTIQPGVMIPADADGSLIVTRGSQIFAEGTAEQPIIFTSLAEYNHITDPVNFPNAPEIGDNGEWGGVLILGKAPINFYVAGNPFTGGLTGNTNTGENQIEGVSAGPDNDGDGHGDLLEYGQDNALVGGLLEVVTPADPRTTPASSNTSPSASAARCWVSTTRSTA
jgi:trimeric autotransporter adhesin